MRRCGGLIALMLLAACSRPLAPPPGPAVTSAYGLASETKISRIAFASCLNENKPVAILGSVSAAKPELFIFAGDTVYGDFYRGKWLRQASEAALASSYQTLARHADFQRFTGTGLPILATWDDHDYGLNDSGVEMGLKQVSKDYLLDFFAVPETAPVRRRPGLYQSRFYGPPGARLQIILLDTRWFRSPLKRTDRPAKGKERYVPDPDPAKTMLGPAQWLWLEQELGKPADLRLLVSSVQVLADGHGYERWGNLPRERERLYRLLARANGGDIVALSGDRHLGGIYRRELADGIIMHEVTSSSLNRAFAFWFREAGPNRIGPVYAPTNFGLITIDWAARRVDLAIRNSSGERVRGIGFDLRRRPAMSALPGDSLASRRRHPPG